MLKRNESALKENDDNGLLLPSIVGGIRRIRHTELAFYLVLRDY
jgi:hypothetical protein